MGFQYKEAGFSEDETCSGPNNQQIPPIIGIRVLYSDVDGIPLSLVGCQHITRDQRCGYVDPEGQEILPLCKFIAHRRLFESSFSRV